LLLAVVVVVLELHQEVGVHELLAVRIDERGKGSRVALKPQGDFVEHIAGGALRVILWHLRPPSRPGCGNRLEFGGRFSSADSVSRAPVRNRRRFL
jgi:hypothetical protein